MVDGGYYGFPNYDTWNVVLWVVNDEELWNVVSRKIRIFERHGMLMDEDIIFCVKSGYAERFQSRSTPDDVSLDSPTVHWNHVVGMMRELFDLDDSDPDAVSIVEDWESRDSFGRKIY